MLNPTKFEVFKGLNLPDPKSSIPFDTLTEIGDALYVGPYTDTLISSVRSAVVKRNKDKDGKKFGARKHNGGVYVSRIAPKGVAS
jgi:hypothetical protein